MLIIDSREHELILLLKKSGIEFEIEMLVTGDVIVNGFIVELKNGNDLTSSIYDNRIFFQDDKMKRSGLKKCVIIYNLKDAYKKIRNRNVINGFMTMMILKGCTIVQVENISDVVYVIKRLNQKTDEKRERSDFLNFPFPRFKNDYERKVAALCCADKVSVKRSKMLLERFKSIENVWKNKDKISEIPGFGKVISDNVIKLLE